VAKRRRWITKVLVTLLAVLFSGAGVAWYFFSGPRLAHFLAKTLFDQIIGIEGRIEIESVEWAPFDIFRRDLPVTAKEVRIYGPQIGQKPLPRTSQCPPVAPGLERTPGSCCDKFPEEETCRPLLAHVPHFTARCDWWTAAWPFGEHDVTISEVDIPYGWVTIEAELPESPGSPTRIGFIEAFRPRAEKLAEASPPSDEGPKGPIIRVVSGQLRNMHVILDFPAFRAELFGLETPWRNLGDAEGNDDLLWASLRDPRGAAEDRPVLLTKLDGAKVAVAQILMKTPPQRLVVLRDISLEKIAIPEIGDVVPDIVRIQGAKAFTVDGGEITANGELRDIFDADDEGPQIDVKVSAHEIGPYVTYHSKGFVGGAGAEAQLHVHGPIIYPLVDVEALGLRVLVPEDPPIYIDSLVGTYDLEDSGLVVADGTVIRALDGRASIRTKGNLGSYDIETLDVVITDPMSMHSYLPWQVAGELGGAEMTGRIRMSGGPGVYRFDAVDLLIGESRVRGRGTWAKVPNPAAGPDDWPFTMGQLRLDELAVTAPSATGRVTGRLDPTKNRIALHFDALVLALGDRLHRLGYPRVGDSVELTGDVTGALSHPIVQAKASVRGLPDTPELVAHGRYDGRTGDLDVTGLAANPFGGRLEGALALTLGKVTRIKSAEIGLLQVDLARAETSFGLPAGTLAGQVRLHVTGGGSVGAPVGELALDIDALKLRGIDLGSLRARAAADPQRGLLLHELTVGQGTSGTLSLHGGVTLVNDPQLSLRLELSRFRLGVFAPLLGLDKVRLDGLASAELEVGGTYSSPTVTGKLGLVRFAILAALLGAGQIELSPEGPGRTRFVGRLFQGKLTVDGVLGLRNGELEVTASIGFRRIDLAEFGPELEEKIGLQGWVSGRVDFRTHPTPYAELHIEKTRLDFDRRDDRGRPLPLAVENRGEIVLGVDFAKARATFLAPATLASSEGEFTVAGFAGLDQLGLDLDGTVQLAVLDFLTKRFLTRLGGDVDVDRAGGVVVMDAHLSGTLEAPLLLGSIRFRDAFLHLRRQDAEIRIPKGEIAVSNSALDVKDMTVEIEGQTLKLGGRVDLIGFVPTKFDLRLDGRLSAEIIEVASPRLVTGARGSAQLSVAVAGTPSDPLVRGFLAFDQPFAFRPRGLRREVAINSGRVRFDNAQVQIDPPIAGTIDDARMRIAGNVTLGADFQPKTALLSFVTDGLVYRDPGVLDLDLSTELELLYSNERLSLRGNVEIRNGRFIQDYDIVDFLKGVLVARRTDERIEPVWKGTPLLENMRLLGIVIRTPGLQVANNIARLTLTGTVELRGTPSRPDLSGVIRAEEGGTITILASKVSPFKVRRGSSVAFVAGQAIPAQTPEINLSAETSYVDLDQIEHVITLEMHGTLDKPRIDMSTNTGLASLGQVIPLIFTGLTTDDLRAKVRGEQGAASNAAAADRFSPASIGGSSSRADELIKQVTGDFLSTVFEDQLKRLLKVDCFRVAPGAVSVQVRLCKNFGRSVTLTGEGEATFQGGRRGTAGIDYRATDSIFIGAEGYTIRPDTPTDPSRNAVRAQVKFKFLIP
jgi:TamB, inner membrane protein subunit of TAM complex